MATRARWLVPGALLLAGCFGPKQPAGPQVLTLHEDTPVSLILLKPLESGVAKTGDPVPLMVTEDVLDTTGAVLIPKGSPARGRVTWSRKADLTSLVTNRPARLEIVVDEATAVDGQKIVLGAGAKRKGEAIAFTRSNVGDARASDALEALWGEADSREFVEKLAEGLEKGDWGDLLDTKESSALLKRVAERVGMPETANLVDRNQMERARSALREVTAGRVAEQLVGGEGAIAITAVAELAKLAGGVGSRLSRTLDAPNIRAPIGTPVTAYVAQDTMVRARAKS
ncbi:MAG: hypothetical protein KIS66_14170 [Fimbriimonadaceae bacterium]|nr:hypothetical protein [Fimbriimonadaceae bacterium]